VRRAALVLALLTASAACGGDDEGPKPTVQATFFPLAEVARAVAGDDANVSDLGSSDSDPHISQAIADYEPGGAPDVNVYLSEGFPDPPGGDAIAVDGLEGLPVVDGDPHVWLDPTMLAQIVTSVRDALSDVAPGRAGAYSENAARYRRTLAALDRRLSAGLADCERNVVVSAHSAWRYFTSRYRIEQEPLGGVLTADAPAPGRAEELAALVRDAGVTTVFREPLVPDEGITALAAATGARIATLDPLEGGGGTYVQRMGRNLAVLRTALGCA
jgi:zinc transport system substrate-binding protein